MLVNYLLLVLYTKHSARSTTEVEFNSTVDLDLIEKKIIWLNNLNKEIEWCSYYTKYDILTKKKKLIRNLLITLLITLTVNFLNCILLKEILF